jgi:hypothetical protein
VACFLGHFGLGLGAKKIAPAVSLGALFAAAQLPTCCGRRFSPASNGWRFGPATVMTPLDFVSYPYSHSLMALCIWGLLFGVVYQGVARCSGGAAGSLAALVVSHWVLDFVVHRPDLPLTFTGTARLGLGLWNSMAATFAIEFSMLLAGLALYLRATDAHDRIGSVGAWSLVLFLVAVFLASAFGPPPPGGRAVAWAGEAMWLLVVWGYWIDRHRAAA